VISGCGAETAYLLRPAAGHRDPSGPQPGSLLVGHVDDGEAAEMLLGLDVWTVCEQRYAALSVEADHGASSSRPPVKMMTPAAFISAVSALAALATPRRSSPVSSGTHSLLKAMRYSAMSPPLRGGP
jgi:hypothetical protein